MVAPQPGTDVVSPDRVEPGITEQYLEVGACGGVALENGGDVFAHGFKERDHDSRAKALKIYILLRGPERQLFPEEQIPRGLKPAPNDKSTTVIGTTKVVPSRNS
jgi:hypothetical protein